MNKTLILCLCVLGTLAIRSEVQQGLLNDSLNQKLKSTSLGRAVLMMSQIQAPNYNSLFDALEQWATQLEQTVDNEKQSYQLLQQNVEQDKTFYTAQVDQYSSEVAQYLIDVRDLLKTRVGYEDELNIKKNELAATNKQKTTTEEQLQSDAKAFEEQTNEINQTILVLDEALKIMDKAKYSSFVQTDADQLKSLADQINTSKITKSLVTLATTDYKDVETLKKTIKLLQDIRKEFSDSALTLKTSYEAQKMSLDDLLAEYNEKVDLLKNEAIPQLQNDIQTKDGELATKKELLNESQQNLNDAQASVAQLNHDHSQSTLIHEHLMSEYSSQLDTIAQCIEALNVNGIKKA